MNLSKRDLLISAFFIIIISTTVSNLYRPFWGYVYAEINTLVLTILSLFKDSWFINKK